MVTILCALQEFITHMLYLVQQQACKLHAQVLSTDRVGWKPCLHSGKNAGALWLQADPSLVKINVLVSNANFPSSCLQT